MIRDPSSYYNLTASDAVFGKVVIKNLKLNHSVTPKAFHGSLEWWFLEGAQVSDNVLPSNEGQLNFCVE
jgi:hypothetical protein